MTQSTAAATDVGEFWADLDGFTVLGNETARAERYDRWIAALAGIPGTDGGAA